VKSIGVIHYCPPLQPLAEGDAERLNDWRGWDPKKKAAARAYTRFIRWLTGDPEA
jgi:hypothetical protein